MLPYSIGSSLFCLGNPLTLDTDLLQIRSAPCIVSCKDACNPSQQVDGLHCTQNKMCIACNTRKDDAAQVVAEIMVVSAGGVCMASQPMTGASS